MLATVRSNPWPRAAYGAAAPGVAIDGAMWPGVHAHAGTTCGLAADASFDGRAAGQLEVGSPGTPADPFDSASLLLTHAGRTVVGAAALRRSERA